MAGIRIGYGYDVHRFGAGRRLVIGGVDIPFEKGLEGHSDADVVVHAIMDALLGSLSLGDIGTHFPDTDPQYREISSLHLLGRVGAIISEKGYSVSNIDSMVIMDHPKIAPFVGAMRRNIADTLSIPEDRVSVKATTNEGMGFVGRDEGVAAHAVVLLIGR